MKYIHCFKKDPLTSALVGIIELGSFILLSESDKINTKKLKFRRLRSKFNLILEL